jgi:hypothetical protein
MRGNETVFLHILGFSCWQKVRKYQLLKAPADIPAKELTWSARLPFLLAE